MAVHIRFLERISVLQALPDDVKSSLAEAMYLQEYSRRGVVCDRNEASGLGFLLEGRLQAIDFTLDGREVGLYFVGQGDFFGEVSAIDGLPPAEILIALAKSHVMHLPRAAARDLIFSNVALSHNIFERLATRVRAATRQRSMLALSNPYQRVCAQLLQLDLDDEGRIPLAPTHQEIAIMINTTRETVTRVFQQLQNKLILKRDGTDIYLLDRDHLLRVVEGREEPSNA